jgi:hypothetical protein
MSILAEKIISYGFVRDNELYRTGIKGAEAIFLKSISEETEAEVIAHYEEQFKKLRAQFIELENRIFGTENKGSFLAKLINLRNLLSSHQGLGDYDTIFTKIDLYESQIKEIITVNRERNTEIKKALLVELEEALKSNDFHEVGEAIKDIKLRWLKIGSVDASIKDEVEGKFASLTKSFYDKRQSFFDDKKMLVESKMNKYDEILLALEKIMKNDGLHLYISKVDQFQKDWKEIGRIPEIEYQQRNAKLKEYCDLFYSELKKDRKKSVSKEDLKGNFRLKQIVLEELKELDGLSLHSDVKVRLEEAKRVWKTTGKVPKGEVDNLNKSYIQLLDSISERLFIFQLASRKFKGFPKKTAEERNKILIKIVNDLLYRDKNELETFKENMDNMHMNKGTFVDMLQDKLKNQERRVLSKQEILKSIKN